MSNLPVGVFDSGIGGLTVVKRINELLPNESIIYIGDTARIPYGPKSPHVVREFSLEIGSYLVARECKAIVIACNTASSFGLSTLTAKLPVPVLGVVGPGAASAVAATKNNRIGVIGTRGTISSEAYQNAILAIRKQCRVFASPAPLLVPLVEEGHLDDAFTRMALEFYLAPLLKEKIDTLVLGCTHYPLLEESIRAFVGPGITVVDSALSSAHSLKDLLDDASLASTNKNGKNRFLATDNPEGFKGQGERFFGRSLGQVQLLSLEELAGGN